MIIGRLLRGAAPYKGELALSVALGVLAIAANVGLLAIAAYLIAAAALKPLLVVLAIPLYIVQAGGVARSITRYSERLATHSVTFRIIARLRAWLFAHLLPLAPARLLPFRSGDVLARLLKDLEELEHLYVRAVAPLTVAILGASAVTLILGVFSLHLALAVVPFYLLAGLLLPWLMQRLLDRQAEPELAARAEMQAHVLDSVQGLADLLACGAVGESMAHLTESDERLRLLNRRRARVGGLHQGALVLIAGGAVGAVLITATPLVRAGQISGVWLACLALLVLGSFEALAPVGTALAQLDRVRAAGRRMFELVDLPPAVTNTTDPRPLPAAWALAFDHVSFTYAPDNPPALEDISFALGASGRLAIVGSSGSGKSTVARLALRMYDPTGGAIRLGAHDISAYGLDALRGAVVLVPQSPYLFTDTLRRNLLLGRPDASDEDLQDAITAAQLDTVVAQLPRGLDTPLGENGLTLSGGERQRVAIARALLMRPRLLILDEATANLDTVTERAVLRAVMVQMAGRAVLLMSHRLVELEDMDEILVLERGKVVERGDYDTLARGGAHFSGLLAAQNEMLAVPTPWVGAPSRDVVLV